MAKQQGNSMKNGDKSQNTNRNKGNRRGGGRKRNNSKSKEIEENVDLDSFNKANLPHVITSAKKDNDASWYTHIYPVVSDYANLSFNAVAGLPFNPIDQKDTYVNLGTFANTTFPGICTIKLDPTIGNASGPTSAVNLAAQQIYSIMRKANSGSTNNIDKTDVMMVILAMDSAYMLYEELLRMYRIFGMYNYMNRYMPDALLTALGFSPVLAQNLSQLRGVIDLFAYKLASVNVPDQFDFIHRHSWLFTNVYTDSDDNKAQMYAYKPAMFYQWAEGQGEQPSYLASVTRSSLYGIGADDVVQTVDEIVFAIDSLMNPILGSQDVGTISADLAKAFGEAGMIKIMPAQDNETLHPVYSPEVLLQMMNATIFYTGSLNGTIAGDITVDYSNLSAGPQLVNSTACSSGSFNEHHAYYSLKRLFNYINFQPTPELNMVASRLMATVKEITTNIMELDSYGTEIAHDMEIWYYKYVNQTPSLNKQTIPQIYPWNPAVYQSKQGLSILMNDVAGINRISAFDWAPTIYNVLIENINDEYMVNYISTMQDVSNYLWIDSDTIKRMNDVAIMSEFAVKDYKTALTK